MALVRLLRTPQVLRRMASQSRAEPVPGLPYKTGSTPALSTPDEAAAGRACLARCHDLLSDRGEVPGARLASDVLALYGSLNPQARAIFFEGLVVDFSAEPTAVRRAAEQYLEKLSATTLLEFQRAGEAPRQELFLRLNAARDGTGLLVQMRHHLLEGLRDRASWAVVEADLAHILKSVFNRGLLEFHQIDWETPAPVLEKLMQYEAVHEIRDWQDLRRRLEADRRCYAFFHPAWPTEPIIFAEVALTRGMSARITPLLDPESAVLETEQCDSAIFYSITNCQPGLRGFAFGNALIGRVMDDLRTRLPRLRTFATLSPIPGFRPWLSALASSSNRSASLDALMQKVTKLSTLGSFSGERLSAELEATLLPLCARYLLHAKQGAEPADPVARFHLRNGARLRRVNWLSDLSRAGLERAAGLTANYVYSPTNLERNCQTYGRERKVNTTRQLERLSRQADLCNLDALPASLPISA
jgi:malonyl-CoA decarboxylase